jgi:hypothetical protein
MLCHFYMLSLYPPSRDKRHRFNQISPKQDISGYLFILDVICHPKFAFVSINASVFHIEFNPFELNINSLKTYLLETHNEFFLNCNSFLV